MHKHRIALIHATPVAMEPIRVASARLWPEAETVNLLDDALSVDRAKTEEITPAISSRIGELADYALGAGAHALLYTCSAFGTAIDAVAQRATVPVLKPNEAMFAAALAAGEKCAMIATFGPSVAGMKAEFAAMAHQAGSNASLQTILDEEANKALQEGDEHRHNALVCEAAKSLDDADVIMLAHFSTARAAPLTREAVSVPVLTSPDTAIEALRRTLAT